MMGSPHGSERSSSDSHSDSHFSQLRWLWVNLGGPVLGIRGCAVRCPCAQPCPPQAQPATLLEQSPRLRQSPTPGILVAVHSWSHRMTPHRRSPLSRPQFPHSPKEGLYGWRWWRRICVGGCRDFRVCAVVAGSWDPRLAREGSASRSCPRGGAFTQGQVGLSG